MGSNLTRIGHIRCAITLLAYLVSFLSATAGAIETFLVEDKEIWLDGCTVVVDDGVNKKRVNTVLKDPCNFAVDGSGRVQIVENNGKKILLVVSSKPDGGTGCDTHVRAVVLEQQKLKISKDTQNIASCVVRNFDEKMFLILGNHLQ